MSVQSDHPTATTSQQKNLVPDVAMECKNLRDHLKYLLNRVSAIEWTNAQSDANDHPEIVQDKKRLLRDAVQNLALSKGDAENYIKNVEIAMDNDSRPFENRRARIRI
ncbi:hypothetical protein VTK26DRAFT_4256 [Humicola hyalothermophila]